MEDHQVVPKVQWVRTFHADSKHLLANTREVAFPLCDADQQAIADLLATCRNRMALGLSANQIGYNLIRVIVIEVGGQLPVVMINPVVSPVLNTTHSKLSEFCLSFPNQTFNIRRPNTIRVRYRDITGSVVTQQFDGIVARTIQRQYDLLNNVLITDRLSPTAKAMRKKTRHRL